ncbi:DUF6426 family protein [Kitasatospora sp. NPDC059160]|uniref:DUF6426 family protein n=1 Tax=unclassified Kitasatospora TaxID=2633591 RepID=UPI0036992C4A
MKLRNMAMAAALGATVLTAVPAVVTPFTAYASCADDHTSTCDDDPTPEPGDPDPGFPGDPGGGYGGGGGGGGEETVIVPGTNVSEPPVVVTGPTTLPRVEVDGRATRPPTPADPNIPPMSWGGGGSGGDSGNNARVWSSGKTWEQRQNCYRNGSKIPEKHAETIGYTINFETSANLTAKAGDVLTAALGTKLNTNLTRSQSIDITLNPGDTWALYVEYQTVTYQITTWNGRAYDVEYVNVTAPTGIATGRSC